MSYLVITDTTGIQSYIFNSNKLSEIIGASYLVQQATDESKARKLASPGRLIYANGGNCIAEFETESQAQAFIKELSKWAYEEAPGVELVFGISKNNNASPQHRVKSAFKDIEEKKKSRPTSQPLLGLSVTKACYSTGLPTSYFDPSEKRYISSIIKAKQNVTENANQKLLNVFLGDDRKYSFPLDLDHLGRSTGDTSLIAVVHIDGNGIGERLIKMSEIQGNYFSQLKEFSDKLSTIGTHALKNTIEDLKRSIVKDENEHLIRSGVENLPPIKLKENKKEKGKYFLPFRPIIFGGDDITFVCDGRIGISMAIQCMKHIKQLSQDKENYLPDGKGLITASAGVAIVKSHYPFARAYQLADELCKSAKAYRKELKDETGNFIDWYIASSGITGSLSEMRKKKYDLCIENGKRKKSLTQRPISIGVEQVTEPERTWEMVFNSFKYFQKNYAQKRNMLKELREVLRKEDEVKKFISRYGDLPKLGYNENMLQNGWYCCNDDSGNETRHCVYYDAIELLDLWIPIESINDEG